MRRTERPAWRRKLRRIDTTRLVIIALAFLLALLAGYVLGQNKGP